MAVDQGLIGNTSQFMVDETGKRVILDLSHCVCCDQTVEGTCGECVDQVGETVTVDLGTTAFTAAGGGYAYGDCETPCNNLENEIVLTETESGCFWQKLYEPFCQRYTSLPGIGLVDINLSIIARVMFLSSLGGFGWLVRFQSWSVVPVALLVNNRTVDYEILAGTVCTGKTYTPMTKTTDLYYPSLYNSGNPFLPCKSGGDSDIWEFPETIDLIIP